MYLVDRTAPQRLAADFPALYRFLLNKWYFDELYDFIFVRPAFAIGRLFWKGGDGAIIDGFGPDGISARVLDVTRSAVRLQTGYVYHYAFAMLHRRRCADDLVSVRRGHAMNGSWILSGILALPLIGALFILLLPGDSEATKRNARWIALFATLITFAAEPRRLVPLRSGAARLSAGRGARLVLARRSCTSLASTAFRCRSSCSRLS